MPKRPFNSITRCALALALTLTLSLLAGGGAWAQSVLRTQGLWLDDRAQPFDMASLEGGSTVLTMAYGACRRICSTSLRIMENVQALADQRHVALRFVVVGLDPSQDKPADWAAFRTERKLERPNWYFLSGDEAATRRFANRLGVHYWRYGEHTVHDFKIVLLSPDGKMLRSIETFDDKLALLLP